MHGLRAVLAAYYGVCSFRKRPQDLPASSVLLYLTIAADAALNFTFAVLIPDTLNAPLFCTIHTAVPLLFLAALLQLFQFANRALKALIAQSGTSLVLKLVALPIVFVIGQSGSTPSLLVVLAWFTVLIWSITVQTFVFHHTLSIPRLGAFALTIALSVLLLSLERALAPVAPG